MHRNNVPLRVLQEISGHCNLEQLQRYLEVESDPVRGAMGIRVASRREAPPEAIAMLSMLTPVAEVDGKGSPQNEQCQPF